MDQTKTKKRADNLLFFTIASIYLFSIWMSLYGSNNTEIHFLIGGHVRKLKFVAEDLGNWFTITVLLSYIAFTYRPNEFKKGTDLNKIIIIWALIMAGLDFLHLTLAGYRSLGEIRGSDIKLITSIILTVCYLRYRSTR